MTAILLHPLYCFGSTKRTQSEWKKWAVGLSGGLGCWVGLGISSKVHFINVLSLWFPFSFTSTFPSKLSFLQCFPNPTSLWCVGHSSQDLAAGSPHVPRRCQSPVIQKKILPTDLPEPLKGTRSRGEMEKISPIRGQIAPRRKADLHGVQCVKHQQHAVSCTACHTHANSSGVFQEHFQLPGGFPIVISYRSWCYEPQRPPIHSLGTWACCSWPKNSQILQLAVGVMKTWNKSSLLLISFSLSWLFPWLFLYLALHPMTSLSPFSCGPTPEPAPPFPECPS